LWTLSIQFALVPLNSRPWFPLSWPTAWAIATNAITLLAAFVIVVESRLRFDRLAGRMAGSSWPPQREGVVEETKAGVRESGVQEEAGVSS
jgi:hypothetical protein